MKTINIIQYIFRLMAFSLILLSSSSSFGLPESGSSSRIDERKIKYIAYMMAAPKGSGQSSFGHSYLLFKGAEYASPTDKAIEFVAAVNPSEISYLRGLGIFPYDRQVVLEKFDAVKKDITMIQNRDLLIYDLNLSAEQRHKIVSKINQILDTGGMGHYSFLGSNCADAVSDIFRDAGLDITGLSAKIPTQLRDKLNEKGLIFNTTNFESKDNTRTSLIKKYSASLKSIPLPKYHRPLDKMFAEATEVQQLFNLLLAKKNMAASSDPNNVDSFINSYWLTLTSIMKKQFKSLMAVPVGSIRLNIKINGPSFTSYKIRSSQIECSDSVCILNVVFSRNDERKDYLSFKLPLKSLSVKGNEVYSEDHLVGVRLGAKSPLSNDTTVSFAATPVFTKYTSNGIDVADIGLIIEPNSNALYRKKSITWNKEIVWQTNTDTQHPMCFTILHLQQAFFEQAIFAPELPRATNEENVRIIKGLLMGRIAVIPGFENAYEFTKSISHTDFIKEIYPIHQQNYQGLLNGMGQWFKLETLKPENLVAMAIITHKLNISVPVIFRKNNNAREAISHSVLITDMRDEGDHYSLSGYDPNYTHTSEFGTIDKKTLLMTTRSYGAVNLFLDEGNLNGSLLNLQFINSPDTRKLLINQANHLKKYSFSSNEILKMQ